MCYAETIRDTAYLLVQRGLKLPHDHIKHLKQLKYIRGGGRSNYTLKGFNPYCWQVKYDYYYQVAESLTILCGIDWGIVLPCWIGNLC